MVAAIIDTISLPRFDTYLTAAGYNRDRALLMYLWNAKVGASFHLPIQAVEVSLRNRVNHALLAEFGPDWWKDRKFRSIIDRERVRDLETVQSRIIRKKIALETGQIVAGLSFGFWIGMLQRRYNPPIWGHRLQESFLHLPRTETRGSLFELGGQVAHFRNRISHHEPIIKDDIMRRYSETMKMLTWLCPDTAAWLRPHCEIPKLVRQKP